ncbi:MAG: heparan-alpha-glucosaminide N-acetyltransferase domain-containing protein, partial [Ornithinimicrobium sp.]
MTTPRIVGIDIARALALLGMVVAHMLDPVLTDHGSPDPWYLLVSGRSSALFAMLAGLSIALTTQARPSAPVVPGPGTWRRPPLRPGARVSLAVRAGSIAFIGLLLGTVGAGVAVILTYYGVLFLCALPVLRWRATSLAVLAVGWALASPVVSIAVRPWLAEPTYQMPSPSFLLDPGQLIGELVVTGYYPVLTWATYLFAGMAIGRLDLHAPGTAARLAMTGLGLAVASVTASWVLTRSVAVQDSLLSSYDGVGDALTWAQLQTELQLGFFGTTPTDSWWWLGVWAPHSASIVDLAHTVGSGMAVLGVCLLVLSRIGAPGQRRASIALGAGTMTLTLYAAHVLLLGAPDRLEWADRISVHLMLLIGVGAAFVAAHARGPLELLVAEIASRAGATAASRHGDV